MVDGFTEDLGEAERIPEVNILSGGERGEDGNGDNRGGGYTCSPTVCKHR